jgi:hypothetical protein
VDEEDLMLSDSVIARWQSKLAPLQVKLDRQYEGWTWTTGGCFAFASAFQSAFGGEFYGVCRPSVENGMTDYPVDHALVKLGDVFYDHDGPYDPESILEGQVIMSRDDDYVCWFEDDFLGDRQWKKVHEVLKGCALEAAASAPVYRP